MKLLRKRHALLANLEDMLHQGMASIPAVPLPDTRSTAEKLAVAAVWVVGGVGVVALGLLAGRELRVRYKVKRRSPYDYYSHSGDRAPDLEFGVGI